MKKILLLLSLLVAFFVSNAQYPVVQFLGRDSALVDSRGGLKARLINYAFTDTTEANTQRISQYPGAMIYTTSGGDKLWLRSSDATLWTRVGSGSGGGGNGIVSLGTSDYGLIIQNDSTYKVDTNLVSTRLWRNKGVDSVQANLTAGLALKLNITDTANIKPRLYAGSNVTISGTYPNLTIAGTDTTSLSNRINSRLSISDTATMLNGYTRLQRFIDSCALMMRVADSFAVSKPLGYLTQYSPKFTGNKLLYGGLHINPGPTYDTSWVVMSSQSLPWMFFMNGQANKIGINNGYPATTFHIKNSENESAPLLVENNSFNTGVQVQVTGPMPGIAFNNTDGLRVFAKVPGTNDFEIFNTAAYGAGTSFHKWFADGSYSNLGSMSVGNLSLTSSAQLAVNSTTKGLLPPRLTTTQRDAITSPAFGLMIYNTTDSAYQFYRASGWAGMGGGSDGNNYTTGITFTQSSRLLAIQRSGLSDVSVTLPNATSALSGMMSGSDKARLDSNSYLTIDKRYDSLAWRRNDSTFLVKSLRLQLNGSTITPTTTDSTLSWNIVTVDTTTVPLITFTAGAGFAADTAMVTDSSLFGSLFTGQYEYTIKEIRAVIKGNSGDSIVMKLVYNDTFNVDGTKINGAGFSLNNRFLGNTVTVSTNRTTATNTWLWLKPEAVIAGKKPKYISVTLLGYKTYVAP